MKKIMLIFSFFFLLTTTSLSFAYDYADIDNYAKDTPKKYDEDLPGLVKYLIKPFRNDDEAKARVIFAWIVYHIDYDDYRSEQIKKKRDVEQSDTFKTRSGVCGDIARLYKRMATIADLDVKYIGGLSADEKGKFKSDNRHAWNEVKLKGKWEHVDATWSIQGGNAFNDISSKSRYKSEMRKRTKYSNKDELFKSRNRRIDDIWFKVEKKLMKETHKKQSEN